MRYFLSLLLVHLVLIPLNAQVPVMLAIPPDARATGMGDVGLATVPDATSQHWNVAKYAFAGNAGGIAFSYTPWLRSIADDINLFYLSGYAAIGEQAISASVRYFSIGELTPDNNMGTPVTYTPNDFAIDAGYSRQFGEYFSLGLAFRYIATHYQERIESFTVNTTNAFAADLGAYFRLPIAKNEWTVGIAFSNIGTKLAMGEGQEGFLPMNLGIGTQYAWRFRNNDFLRLALDINKSLVPQDKPNAGLVSGLFSSFGNSLNQVALSVGAEYSFREKIFLRGGYYYNSPNAGDRSHATLGIGLCLYNSLYFDSSYLIATGSNNNALKNTLRFSVGYTFGKTGKSHQQSMSEQYEN